MGQHETILCDDSTDIPYSQIKLNHLKRQDREDFSHILHEYNDAFARHKNDIGLCTLIKHDIEIKNVPMSQNQRFLPPDKQSFAQKQVDILCKNNIVSIDPQPLCVSNLLLVPKFSSVRDNTKASKMLQDKSKIDSFRLVQDLRLINKNTLNIERTNKVCLDDFIRNLNSKIVTTLDILSAYYHIELTDRAKKLTGFYLGNKTYCWHHMTQGLVSAAGTLTRLWSKVFSEQVLQEFKSNLSENELKIFIFHSYDEFVQAYFDDYFVFTDTMTQHKIAL